MPGGFDFEFGFEFGDDEAGEPVGIAGLSSAQVLGVRRLAQYLKDTVGIPKPNVKAITMMVIEACDEVRQVLEDCVTYRALANAQGKILDEIGQIVGLARQSLTDDDYRLYLQAQVAANRSSGLPEQLYTILGLIAPAGVTYKLLEQFPAAMVYYATGAMTQAQANAAAYFLRTARGGGIGGVLEYGLSDTASSFGFDGAGAGFDTGKFRGALR